MRCQMCLSVIDPALDINDGYVGVCKYCAPVYSEDLYKKLLSVYESEDDLTRMAFAKYGNDDFWNEVNEEFKK